MLEIIVIQRMQSFEQINSDDHIISVEKYNHGNTN